MLLKLSPSTSLMRGLMRWMTRITALALAGLLTACGSIPLPKSAASQPEAAALLEQAQQAHGKAAFAAIKDINVSYDGEWFDLIKRIQPAITDAAFRKTSQERMLVNVE